MKMNRMLSHAAKLLPKNFLLPMLLIFGVLSPGFAQKFVRHSFTKQAAVPTSESYRSFTFNGAWCWFSDPRAVYYEGEHQRTYAGWVDNYGDIIVGYYDHRTQEIKTTTLYDNLEIDDHNNPSLLFDEEGKLTVFFNNHMVGVKPLYQVKALEPESIETWGEMEELHLNDGALADLGSMNHTYTNPIKLSAEGGKLFLFWRGVDGKPSYSTSTDNGETWSKGKIFFMPERKYSFRRPYTKVFSNGKDKIHLVLTDGHPRKEDANNLYYLCYQNGAFYKADGTKVKDLGGEPVKPEEADLVYDAGLGKARGWNWDIAEDAEGNPVIAYAKYPDEQTHIYCYARWDGKKWQNYDLISSGGWFPETVEGQTEREPHYSGGMSIDHETPNTLYLSVKRDSVFEIEKWETSNGGKSWKVERLTAGSSKDNIRPFAVRGAAEGNPLQVLWMQNTKYHYFALQNLDGMGLGFKDRYHTAIQMGIPLPEVADPLQREGILNVMRNAADWHLENPRLEYRPLNWHYGAFFTGLRALVETTGEQRYLNELMNVGQHHDWTPLADIFHADRLTVIDNWLWLYEQFEDPEMIDRSRWAMDIHLARNYKKLTDVRFKDNPYHLEWWTWCDALYMAPPSFVQMGNATGEIKYTQYADTQWWETSDYLYSPEDSLYYRDDRYIGRLSDNGKKIFWSRGNGWVIAGLARMLTHLPEDYENRGKFIQQYQEMAHKLLSIQDEDGLWRVSLLDPEYLDMGESSGSSFFTFALAWGINHGLVGKKYQPQVEKAWKALCANVNEEGRLGYVQQVAGDPYPFKAEESHVYATGAFLLAGKEMLQLVGE